MIKQKILSILFLGILIIPSFIHISINSQGSSNTIEMYPGQTRVFTVEYGNDGDMSELENAFLDIRIGSFLTVNRTTLKDRFDGGTEYAINFENVSVSSGLWGTRIHYRPFSGAIGGSSTPGDVEIEPGKNGIFTFEATLDSNIVGRENPTSGDVYEYGSILSPSDLQGVNSILTFTNGETIPGNLNIVIIRNPNDGDEEEEEELPQDLAEASITVNPSEPKTGQAITIFVSNLARGGEMINGEECEVTIEGEGYSRTLTGSISNGRCEVILDASQSPNRIGEYTVTARVGGEVAAVRRISFGVVETVLSRTGGVTIVFGLAGLGGVFSLVVFYLSRRKKMKLH